MWYEEARQAERESKWLLAESIWNQHGHHSDANACRIIRLCNERGDLWRAIVERKMSEANCSKFVMHGPNRKVEWANGIPAEDVHRIYQEATEEVDAVFPNPLTY